MKKTYATTVPDHVGAFLEAGRCFAALQMNITRVSYNKAVDSNMLFIDAEGTAEQHEEAGRLLEACGYLQEKQEKSVVLLEFKIPDEPGRVVQVLELIKQFDFNISYLSSQENGGAYQLFKMGLFVEDSDKIRRFMEQVEPISHVRVIDYNHSEKIYDNSIFYNSFAGELTRSMELSDEAHQEILVNANLAMQTLDERGLSPYRTFDNISRFAGLLAAGRGENFNPRITHLSLTPQTELTLIEPPCGSNTAILRSGGEYLFIDSGYACYREEMLPLLKREVPQWDTVTKRLLLTHADVDHGGLLNEFDEILVNERTAESLRLEYRREDAFREQNPLHKPYIRICKTLTSYQPVPPEKLRVLWPSPEDQKVPLVQIGFFSFGDLEFEVYEGFGGHLPGEIVLIDYTNHVVFTGDVFVNLRGMTPEQAEYNRCAPILMTSVDTNPVRCAAEREALFRRMGGGKWQVFGAHGAKKDISVVTEK